MYVKFTEIRSIVFVKCKYDGSNRFTLLTLYVGISFGPTWPEFVIQDQRN